MLSQGSPEEYLRLAALNRALQLKSSVGVNTSPVAASEVVEIARYFEAYLKGVALEEIK